MFSIFFKHTIVNVSPTLYIETKNYSCQIASSLAAIYKPFFVRRDQLLQLAIEVLSLNNKTDIHYFNPLFPKKNMNRIEIITQPETEGRVKQTPNKATLEKLKSLISENPPNEEDSLDDPLASDKKPTREKSHQLQDSKDTPAALAHDTTKEKVYDDDGFEIPQGKIPLDGHFSTNEIRELVNLAKLENFLKPTVEVRVIEENSLVGDKVVIMEPESEPKEGKDNDKEEGKEI